LSAPAKGGLIDCAIATRVDALVAFCHSRHAAFVPAEKSAGFRLLIHGGLFVDARGGALHEDTFQRLRFLGGCETVVDEAELIGAPRASTFGQRWRERRCRSLAAAPGLRR